MAGGSPWYAGRCIRRHDVIGEIEVIARREGQAWVAVENPEKLFPRTGSIEIRGVDTRQLRIGDWVIFQLATRMGRGLWKASQYRRLCQYKDLSEKGSMDEIHRILAVEGISGPESVGFWAIRVSKDALVQVELVRSGQAAVLAPGTTQVVAYDFISDNLLLMPCQGKAVELYDFDQDASPREIHDWSPETNYILRVVHALAIADTPEVSRIIAWLEAHAHRAGERLSLNSADLVAAHEAVRSGTLAKRLSEDGHLLQALVDALKRDGRVRELIERRVEAIAEEERSTLHAQEKIKLESMLREREQQALEQLQEKIHGMEDAGRRRIEDSLASRERDVEKSLAARSAQGLLELEELLGQQKRSLENEVENLSLSKASLEAKAASLMKEVGDLEVRSEDLRQRQKEAGEDLDRLLAARSLAKETSHRPEVMVPVSVPIKRGKSVSASEVNELIFRNPLLTPHGRLLMQRFIILLLAGDVPVLCGPEVDAFLRIAEATISSGWSASMEADPTVITFEDVWVRAGTSVPTALGRAFQLCDRAGDTTCLAVIKNIERSGARFWLPTLVERSRRAEFPRRLLLAVTVGDRECEEALSISKEAIQLEIKSAIEVLAPQLAPLTIRIEASNELDPGDDPRSIQQAALVASALVQCTDVNLALRGARIAAEASRWAVGDDQKQIVDSMIEFFLNNSRTGAMSKEFLLGDSINA
jgi:hypothetical protein